MEEKNNSQNLLEEEKQNESEDSNSFIKSKELDLEKEFEEIQKQIFKNKY